MLYKSDGTEYRLAGTRQQFNDLSPDLDLFNIWDQEAIRVGGSPIYYNEVFIPEQTTDPLYLENRGKIWNPTPIELWAVYEPIPASNIQTAFGIDGQDEMMFELNYRSVLDALNHYPKRDSIITSPFLNEKWQLVLTKLSEFKMYKALRIQFLCKRYQEDDIGGNNQELDIKYKIV